MLNELQFLESILNEALGKSFKIKEVQGLSGGCINNSVKIECEHERFFIKWNNASFGPMFESEARGLKLLKGTGEIDIPEVFAHGSNFNCSYLILEYIESGLPGENYWNDFGLKLSKMHRHTKLWYGLEFNNYIGTLPQKNEKKDRWESFFMERRLEPQVKIAFESGKIDQKIVSDFYSLYKKIPGILIEEHPALLHGDLWSGNVMTSSNGNTCLVDPAVYYGNREIEIAFTLLFGGFKKEFYQSYFENFPVEKGFEQRSEIYNLYPLLVHLNLFGGGYLHQIIQVLKNYI
jgi:protein-ribulosamine 3-kinase